MKRNRRGLSRSCSSSRSAYQEVVQPPALVVGTGVHAIVPVGVAGHLGILMPPHICEASTYEQLAERVPLFLHKPVHHLSCNCQQVKSNIRSLALVGARQPRIMARMKCSDFAHNTQFNIRLNRFYVVLCGHAYPWQGAACSFALQCMSQAVRVSAVE